MRIEIINIKLSDNIIENLVTPEKMLKIHQELEKTIYPWTPYLTGKLSSDTTVTENGVTYNVDYAAKKYYGEVYCKDHHPLATSHWDRVAMQTEIDSFAKKVGEILTNG